MLISYIINTMYISNNGKFKEGIIWWDTKIESNADVDVFFFIHDFEGRAKHKYGFKTLEIDLTKTNEEIQNDYVQSLRRQIRRSKEFGFEIKFIDKPTKEDIERFVKTYNSFADFKKLQNTSVELLEAINKDGKLVISECYYNNELIVAHSHYMAGDRTRLYQSASTNNSLEGKDNAQANKLLTDSDIMYFKEKKIKIYDFGGIGNVEGDNTRFEGIIKFKKLFGGSEKILWKGVTPNGERGEVIYKKYWK